MSADYLTVNIKYNCNKDEFEISGTVKEEKRSDVIEEFLRTQMGKGEDNSPSKEVDIYTVMLKWHPENDVFTVKSNTGNKGVRDGILISALDYLVEQK